MSWRKFEARLSGTSGPPVSGLCCCSLQWAFVLMSLIGAVFLSSAFDAMTKQYVASFFTAVFVLWSILLDVYFLVTLLLGLVVAAAAACGSQELFKRLICLQFPMQHIAFWLEVVASASSVLGFLVHAFPALFSLQGGIGVLVVLLFGCFTVFYCHLLCKLSYNLFLCAEAGGTGWEGMSAQELIERAADDKKYQQLKAAANANESRSLVVGVAASESDPLLPSAANNNFDDTQPTLTVQI